MAVNWTGVAAATTLAVAAALVYLTKASETFGIAGWLWLISIGVYVASASCLHSAVREDEVPQSGSVPALIGWPNWERATLVGICLAALMLRVWSLREFPDNIYPDEIMAAHIASSSYLDGASRPSVFSTVWGGIDLPALWFFTVSQFLKTGGETLAAVRLPSALVGAATVLPFYGLLRMAWGRTTAIAGAAIMAFSAVNVHYSRLGISNIVTPFFWTICFFFLMRGVLFGRPMNWALAGIVAGLSEYGFYATRLLPFILLAFAVYLFVMRRTQITVYARGFSLLSLGYLIGFGPLLAHFLTHSGLYFRHGITVLVWNRFPNSVVEVGEMCIMLSRNVEQTLLGISVIPSQDLIYFAPLLRPAEVAALILGTALLIHNWRHPVEFLMLLSGLGVLAVGGVLVKPTPSLNHLTGAFPVFCAAIALPIGSTIDQLRERLPANRRWMTAAALVAVLVVLGVSNARFYFRDYSADPDLIINSRYKAAQQGYEIQTALARYLGTLGPDYAVRSVANTSVPYDPELTQYLGGTQDYANVANPLSWPHIERQAGKGIVFVFFGGSERYETEIESRYPGGTMREVTSQAGRLLFRAYTLPPN